MQRNACVSFHGFFTIIFAILGSREIVVQVILDGVRVSGFFLVRVYIVSYMYAEMLDLRG